MFCYSCPRVSLRFALGYHLRPPWGKLDYPKRQRRNEGRAEGILELLLFGFCLSFPLRSSRLERSGRENSTGSEKKRIANAIRFFVRYSLTQLYQNASVNSCIARSTPIARAISSTGAANRPTDVSLPSPEAPPVLVTGLKSNSLGAAWIRNM